MKVSLNLAQAFSNVDLKAIPREELLQRIGAQLGAVEDVVDWAPRFEGAVIVKVVECKKHENADKLNVCRVDDGGKNKSVERGQDGLVQVVCGAPNVKAGMFAVWLAPGVTVPASRDEAPFVLEARAIRGVVSNGMMASSSELGISEDHAGILEVPAEIKPVTGSPLTDYFGLDDYVIDCENKMFTHRPDCFGVLGVARELAGISGLEFRSPDWYLLPEIHEAVSDLKFTSRNDIPNLVPRFTVQLVQGVKVMPSTVSMQGVLTRSGIKPINNLVDLSNFYMQLTAQPTHAFDYDKLLKLSKGVEPVLMPRLAKKGEKLTLLGGKEIELTEDDIVIATDKTPVALAGIMGGADTEVDENTKNILIEAATFDMYSIRRSSMRHGLFTDASNRFNKGQSPAQNLMVLSKLVGDIVTQTGAKPGMTYDSGGPEELAQVKVSAEFINQRLGSDLKAKQMAEMLENVEFEVDVKGDKLVIDVPFWRMDIEIPEDIVEEIGRLYGFDKLPVELPARLAKPTPKNSQFEFKQQMRNVLVKAGANEALTYSFVHGDLMEKAGTNAKKSAYHLRNALSPDLQYYRTSLVPSLLTKVFPNIKAGAGSVDNQFALFEIGKVHIKDVLDKEGLPEAYQNVAFVASADDKTAKAKQAGTAYYLAKKYVDLITNGQAEYVELTSLSHPVYSHYQAGRCAGVVVGDKKIGVVGELNQKVAKALKLPAFTAAFELELTQLEENLRSTPYKPLPLFPGSDADITLEVDAKKSYQTVEAKLRTSLEAIAQEHGYNWSLAPGDIFAPEGSKTKRLTFRIELNHPDKTLRTEEVSSVIDDLARVAKTIGAKKV